MRIASAIVAGGLVLGAAACGEAPKDDKNAGGTGGKKFSACMVTDVGGIDDKSFNTSAWKGLQEAKNENDNIDIKNVQSKAEADYEVNLTGFVNQKCDFILAVGGLMSDATKKAAQANPKQQFAIVDSNPGLDNIYPMQFDTAQAAFQAGYLAAGMSKTGKVGTYGGLPIPPVTIFMDGFADGVAYYNKAKGKNVQVLGWDKATQKGSFTNDFVKQDEGKKVSDALVAQGADIVMPVAGGAGLGTTAAAQASNGKYSVIWVDVDGCESTPNCPALVTTVVKNIPDAVKEAVLKAAGGEKLEAKPGFVGTLANNGVSIAPYHDFDSKVPADLKAEVDKIKADIAAGTITVTSKAQPTK
ncbi:MULTISPECIES: BMP family protein [Micromonospora]|uniref:BMP family ABC transporter substrate-binding protein n=1 Tax=Micromonospora solifontis TaxID=2487138 RepID=A0ABX9WBV1_9ACTN|nr:MULTISPECIES: BMP family ABC transporter substrate-binding protein [Micromonospora]NES14255.1 BMP family ABC transporter substrate-binding protein [Micromonospora sp. PPF5-17B]NES38471.1 BMP family ABC transporter substrate-binding protein [Micromonospora solifontis]NES55796.1 BMP family ABC transporter substrate-binding protein [Micromonospora sp. PPF5-6]RNL95774.1 BMP family ABC transporter substrate-binding protein [Micromonospora solifontis]